MALVGALAIAVNVVTEFTNRSLRAQVSTLLGIDYTMSQASYDLRRLRRKGHWQSPETVETPVEVIL
jgi:hypothetical protein